MRTDSETDASVEFIPTPAAFKCPLTHDILEDPVATADGQVYERACIVEWFRHGNDTSPLTSMTLPTLKLVTNEALKRAIDEYVRLRPDLRRKAVEQRGYEFAVTLWAEELAKKRGQKSDQQDKGACEDMRLLKEELQAKESEVILLGQTMARRCLDHRDAFDDLVSLSKDQLRARDAEIALLKHQLAEKKSNRPSATLEGETKISFLKDQLANEKRSEKLAACLLEGDAKISILKEKLASDKRKSKLVPPPPAVERCLGPALSMEQITVGSCATPGRCNVPASLVKERVAGSRIQKGKVIMEKGKSSGLNDPEAKGTADNFYIGDGIGDVSAMTSVARAMAKGRVSTMTPEERVKACAEAARASKERQKPTLR